MRRRTIALPELLLAEADNAILFHVTETGTPRFTSRSHFFRVAVHWFLNPDRQFFIPEELRPPAIRSQLPASVGTILKGGKR